MTGDLLQKFLYTY